jgi:DNA polymerase-3 subunit gamma/tau
VPVPHQAVEMLIVRLAYAAKLPSPAELVRKLQREGAADGGSTPPAVGTPRLPPPADRPSGTAKGSGQVEALALALPSPAEAPPADAPLAAAVTPAAVDAGSVELVPDPQDFRSLVALFAARREGMLYAHLYSNVHLVRFEPGRVELRPAGPAPANLANRVAQLVKEWTGRLWMVSVSGAPGEPTLSEQDRETVARAKDEASRHPVVRAVLEAFPGARIEAVRDLAETASGAGGDPVAAGVDDEPAPLDGTDEEGEL